MKSVKYLGLALVATTLLGAAPAFAATGGTIEADKLNGNTDTEVSFEKITERNDEDAKLELQAVPTSYKFVTKYTGNNEYTITGGKISDAPANVYKVYDNVVNDAAGWTVSSKIENNELKSGSTVVEVSGFTLDGKSLLGGTIFSKTEGVTKDDTGTIYTHEAKNVSITIKPKTGEIKSDDKFTGNLVTTLASTPVAP